MSLSQVFDKTANHINRAHPGVNVKNDDVCKKPNEYSNNKPGSEI